MLVNPYVFSTGGSPPGGSQRQVMVPGPAGPVCVNTTASADLQYALPNAAHFNEQS